MIIVQVIPISKSIRTSVLSYFSAKDIELGTLVTVPLRKKEISAIVVAKESALNAKSMLRSADYQIRNVLAIHKEHIFSPAFLEMAWEISQYYATHTGIVLDSLLPKSITRDVSFFSRDISTSKQGSKTSHVALLQRPKDERISYYKTRVREAFASKNSLYIVCPTVDECIELHAHISKGIEQQSFLFHGSLTAKKLRDQFTKLTQHDGPVCLVGTAGCVSLAPENTNEFIIESASSSSYEHLVHPKLDKTLCVERLAYHGAARCVYADTVLSVDLWSRAYNKEIDIIEPSNQKIFDTKKLKILSYSLGENKQSEEERIKELKHNKNSFHPLHFLSMEAIKQGIANKENIFIFVPKKGMSPNMVCNDCGKLAVSPHSGLPYSLYTQVNATTKQKENVYICNASGEKVAAFDLCQFCKGRNLKKMGIASSGLAEQLQKDLGPLLKDVDVNIIDAQHCKTKKSIKAAQDLHRKDKASIFIGTSKALSVLPSWDTGIIVTLAPLLSVMSYRNEEQLVYLSSKIYEKTQSKLYLQDRKDIAQHLPILQSGMYPDFVKQELKNRKEFNYPPFQTLIHIKVTVKKNELGVHYRHYLKRFESYDPSIMVQPHTASYAIIQIIIKLDVDKWSITKQVENLKNELQMQERNVEVSINPRKLL